jgi:hypothetical protein
MQFFAGKFGDFQSFEERVRQRHVERRRRVAPPASLPFPSTPASRSDALQFASLAVTSLPENFHLKSMPMPGAHNKKAG